MKVCATVQLGPWNSTAERFDTIAAAVAWFTSEVAGQDYGPGLGSVEGGDEQCMDVYPQCDDCYTGATFHEFAIARFSVGPRGGVRRERGGW